MTIKTALPPLYGGVSVPDLLPRHVLWGSAGHAKVLADLIELQGGSVAALFDNDPESSSCLEGVVLFHGEAGFLKWIAAQGSCAEFRGAVAVGGARGADRRLIARRFSDAGIATPTLIHPSAVVARSARFDDACQVLAGAVVAADVRVGPACIVNNSANVDHECHLEGGVHVAPGAVLCGCVVVGEDAMVGAGAVVLPRVRIGPGAIVGAGAVVVRDVPAGAVVVGNPADIMRIEKK
jgi:sugar O-acyltransferase (sialic acid O-acetyltransferase NeuD family)